MFEFLFKAKKWQLFLWIGISLIIILFHTVLSTSSTQTSWTSMIYEKRLKILIMTMFLLLNIYGARQLLEFRNFRLKKSSFIFFFILLFSSIFYQYISIYFLGVSFVLILSSLAQLWWVSVRTKDLILYNAILLGVSTIIYPHILIWVVFSLIFFFYHTKFSIRTILIFFIGLCIGPIYYYSYQFLMDIPINGLFFLGEFSEVFPSRFILHSKELYGIILPLIIGTLLLLNIFNTKIKNTKTPKVYLFTVKSLFLFSIIQLLITQDFKAISTLYLVCSILLSGYFSSERRPSKFKKKLFYIVVLLLLCFGCIFFQI